MRRATAIVGAAYLCAITGCRGGAAREPYDGIGVAARGPSTAVSIPAPPTAVGEPIASEVDVPWTIALLSDVETPPVEADGDVVRAEPVAMVEDPTPDEETTDLEVAFEHDRPDQKPPTSAKSCPGVVKGRS